MHSVVGKSLIISEMSDGLVQRIYTHTRRGKSIHIVNKYIDALYRTNYRACGTRICLPRLIFERAKLGGG